MAGFSVKHVHLLLSGLTSETKLTNTFVGLSHEFVVAVGPTKNHTKKVKVFFLYMD